MIARIQEIWNDGGTGWLEKCKTMVNFQPWERQRVRHIQTLLLSPPTRSKSSNATQPLGCRVTVYEVATTTATQPFRKRAIRAIPARPVPNSQTAAGNGTGDVAALPFKSKLPTPTKSWGRLYTWSQAM